MTMMNTLAGFGVAAALVAAGASPAAAGGFALKEGSTAAQGTSFAGATAGGDDITYTFFNPAALRNVKGVQIGFSNSGIFSDAELETSGGDWTSDEIGLVGAFYLGARISDRMVVGVNIEAPYGLATEWDKGWTGRYDGLRTDLKTIAITPMLSYDVNPDFTIGVGVTYLYGQLTFENTLFTGSDQNYELLGDGDAWGFRVGALWDVTPHTTIGLAFKSGYNFEGDGDVEIRGPVGLIPNGDYASKASADLPPVVSLGVNMELTETFTLMGEVQIQAWSSLETFRVQSPTIPVPQLQDVQDAFEYKDAVFVAVGGEYVASEDLTLRSGVAFDQTPTVDEHRSPRIPDGDRIWLSAGASYMLIDGLKLDVAYSFITTIDDVDIPLDSNPLAPGDDEIASGEGQVHIFSLGASYEF